MGSKQLMKIAKPVCTFLSCAMLVVLTFDAGRLSAEQPSPESTVDVSAIDVSSIDSIHFETTTATDTVVIHGRDERWQLIVTAHHHQGRLQDVTHQVAYSSQPPGIVEISGEGVVKPLAAGEATIIAQLEGLPAIHQPVRVEAFDQDQPVNFPNQVVPIFTKLSCNGGGCHGKLAGQNGFRLSLLGFEPRDDYEFLVRESRGRRLFPAAPEKSLLLTKGAAQVPHGGGARLEVDSHEYRLLRRWIAQGMPYGSDNDPVVAKLEVIPAGRIMQRGGQQQLKVLAHYTDGHIEDVTKTVQYESNDPEMAEVTVGGLVSTRQLAGDVSIMMRYQGDVAVFRATLPLQDTPPELPAPKNVVDNAVFAHLTKLGIPVSPLANDSEFIRRLTLDLTGRLPTVEETKQFLASTEPNKRDQLIDSLLGSEQHAEYFASKWSQILRNRRDNDNYKYGSFALHQWLRQQFYHNRPYDEIVRDIVAASGDLTVHPPVAWYRQVTDINQQVEDTAQLFLGQRIQCARCHHHPFEKWSQQDYGQLAAFFSLVSKKQGPTPEEPIVFSRVGNPSQPNPRGGPALVPAGLGAEPATILPTADPRHALMDWMAADNNPFFAPSLVNRYWKHFFGRGLVDPEDDMRVTNPASNPELLTGLSDQFVSSGFDLRKLIRTIVESETYQRSDVANELNIKDERNHSRFYPKRLQAEVLLDAVDTILGTTSKFSGMPVGTRAVGLPDTNFDSYFLTVFGRPQSTTACECERESDPNLAQSLHLLNSKEMQSKLTTDSGRAATYAAQLDQAGTDQLQSVVRSQIEEIYQVAFARAPRPEEMEPLVEHIAGNENRRAALEDVLWAVINSKEFLFNH